MLRYFIRKERVVNAGWPDGFVNFYAVDAETQQRIAGTDGATEADCDWMCCHWNSGATRAVETIPTEDKE